MLGNFSCFSCSLELFQNNIRNTIRVSNGLDPDQVQHSVGPDLGLSADDTRRQTVSMTNGLDPDRAQHSVGPDLIQTVCKDHQQKTKFIASRQRVNSLVPLSSDTSITGKGLCTVTAHRMVTSVAPLVSPLSHFSP